MSVERSLADKAKALKAGAKAPRKKKEWVPPTLADFAPGHVLAFDQTFSNTGYCHIWFSGTTLSVLARGIIREPPLPDLTGQEDTLQRATWMAERIKNIHWECSNAIMQNGDLVVVHERPIVHGMRIESSLLGGLGVWLAVSPKKPVLIHNTRMRGVMTGQPRSNSKALITEACNRYIDTKGWNADQRDALCLALTYLYDKKRAT